MQPQIRKWELICSVWLNCLPPSLEGPDSATTSWGFSQFCDLPLPHLSLFLLSSFSSPHSPLLTLELQGKGLGSHMQPLLCLHFVPLCPPQCLRCECLLIAPQGDHQQHPLEHRAKSYLSWNDWYWLPRALVWCNGLFLLWPWNPWKWMGVKGERGKFLERQRERRKWIPNWSPYLESGWAAEMWANEPAEGSLAKESCMPYPTGSPWSLLLKLISLFSSFSTSCH